jgi:putative FmdB family regulatory protein
VPIYEYACMTCKKVVSVYVRRIGSKARVKCPDCAGSDLHRVISGFAFHLSLTSKLDQLDPKYDKMIDAANPDLAFDNLVKTYGLDRPVPKAKPKK